MRYRPSPAMVVAVLALFVALGGVGYALTIPRNSVGAKQIKRGAVRSIEVRNNKLTGRDIRESTLRQVRSALDTSSLQGQTLNQVRAGIDALTLGGITPGGFMQGSGRFLSSTRSLSNAGPPTSDGLVEAPGLGKLTAGFDTVPSANCNVALDAAPSGQRQVEGFGSEDGSFFGLHVAPTGAEVGLNSVESDGEGSVSLAQVRTTGASPQLFTVWVAVRWQGNQCLSSVQVVGG
jgi:hypothetical protein